jgi:hypothetical protein
MKRTNQFICVVLAIAGAACSARVPPIVHDMRSATGREAQTRFFNRISTNPQERSELFAYMDARPDSAAAAKSKLLMFYADQSNKTAALPTPLDLSLISPPQHTCEGLNYRFSSPWPEFVVSAGSEGQWVAFQDNQGRMMMMSISMTTNAFDEFVARELSSVTNDLNWIQTLAFPDNRNIHGIELYRRCLSITPNDMSSCTNMEGAFQYLARMVIKLVLLSGNSSPIINELQTGDYEGYQVQDASKPGRYILRLFDNTGSHIELVFGFKTEQETSISQADVNCVLLSLKKIKDAEQSNPAYPPQGIGSAAP